MAKVSELWSEVEQVFNEKTSTALKMAIIEAHKILEAVLESKKYPGKSIEQKLVWAGYSLKGKDELAEALQKHQEILVKFDYLLTNIEAEDILKTYQKTINKVASKPDFDITDSIKAFFQIYFSPKSVLFWRNITVAIGFFGIIKFLSSSEVGGQTTQWVVSVSDFVISWPFWVIVGVVILIVYLLNNYLENKNKIKIKD